jgi:hypothetical protein
MVAVCACLGLSLSPSLGLGRVLAAAPGGDERSDGPSLVPPGWKLVHHFDFDERQRGNVDQMPMHWYAVGREADTVDPNFIHQPLHQELTSRPGYPRYGEVRFDQRQRTSGQSSFHLGVRGGDVGAFLGVGAVAAVPGSDYLITANVRLDDLRHARATVTAYLIDDRGRRIDDSRTRVEAEPVNGRWQRVELRLIGEGREAAWIGMELTVRQPRRPQGQAGEQEIVLRDVRGGAWFDDITLWQVPRVAVGTQSPVNVIRHPQRPRIWTEVRDATGRALKARLRLVDHRGRELARTVRDLRDGRGGRWEWQPPIDRFGWYKVLLALEDAEGPADPSAAYEQVYGAFLYLPNLERQERQPTQRHGAGRFGLEAVDRSMDELALLPDFMQALDYRAAVLSCWHPRLAVEDMASHLARLGHVLTDLHKADVETGLTLAPLPAALVSSATDEHDALFLFARDEPMLPAYLKPVLLREGQRVRYWHLGASHAGEGFFVPRLAAIVDQARAAFLAAAPEPTLVLPWDISQTLRDDLNQGVAYMLNVPPSVRPTHIVEHLANWSEQQVSRIHGMQLRTQAADTLDQARRIEDLARRVLYAWQLQPPRLLLDAPWTVAADRQTQLLPDPVAGVFSRMASHLTGRVYVADIPVGEGMRGMVFHGPRGGLLAVWNESAADGQAVMRLYLGDSPRAFDVWGNSVEVPLTGSHHEVHVTPSPLLIEGIDTPLAVFRAAFAVHPPLIESTHVRHERTLHIVNPWAQTLGGSMHITGPEHWRIEPRVLRLSIPAGQTLQVPVALMFPVSQLGGAQQLTAQFDFTTDRPYAVELTAAMEIALPGVEWDAQLSVERQTDGTLDAVVTQMLANRKDEPISMFAFAAMPQSPRQEQLIARLMPGESIMRQFRFRDIGDQLGREQIRVGIREAAGPAGLNKILDLE